MQFLNWTPKYIFINCSIQNEDHSNIKSINIKVIFSKLEMVLSQVAILPLLVLHDPEPDVEKSTERMTCT